MFGLKERPAVEQEAAPELTDAQRRELASREWVAKDMERRKLAAQKGQEAASGAQALEDERQRQRVAQHEQRQQEARLRATTMSQRGLARKNTLEQLSRDAHRVVSESQAAFNAAVEAGNLDAAIEAYARREGARVAGDKADWELGRR